MDPCDEDIFQNGDSVCTIDACKHRAEKFAQAVALQSGQRVDWHYSGGIANVLYIGDHALVDLAVSQCEPLLWLKEARVDGECGSCSGDIHRTGVILRRFGAKAHGPYRAGDPLPAGTIAVDTIHDVAIMGGPRAV